MADLARDRRVALLRVLVHRMRTFLIALVVVHSTRVLCSWRP